MSFSFARLRLLTLRVLTLVLLPAALACDGDGDDNDDDGGTGPDVEHGTPGIHVVAGADVTDTIGAQPTQALVVEVFDEEGRAATGSVVRFETLDGEAWVYPGRLDGEGESILAVDTPDARGRAAVLVRFGHRTGVARLAIVVPELGMTDTATFIVTPGAPESMSATPIDTAAYVGNGYTLTAQVFDRAGNPLDVPSEISVLSGPVSVSGNDVTGDAIGRGAMEVRAAGFVDTARVSVVPEGTLAAFTGPAHTGQAASLWTFDLDGSDLRLVATTKIGAGYFGDMPATWSADGSRLVYHDNNNDHTKTLYEVNLATLVTNRFIGTGGLDDERWPLFSPDGDWVLFNGGSWSEQTAYRVQADGSNPAPIGPPGALHPAMSPDGDRIAYQLGDSLYVMHLGTGVQTSLNARGWLPVWAPSGAEIFYTAGTNDWDIAGPVRAVAPNGTGNRAVSSSSIRWRVTVSPDGDWLVGAAAGGSHLVLIDVQTRAELPLAFVWRDSEWWGDTLAFSAPVWKP